MSVVNINSYRKVKTRKQKRPCLFRPEWPHSRGQELRRASPDEESAVRWNDRFPQILHETPFLDKTLEEICRNVRESQKSSIKLGRVFWSLKSDLMPKED